MITTRPETRADLVRENARLRQQVGERDDVIQHLHRTLDKAIAALCAWNEIELPNPNPTEPH